MTQQQHSKYGRLVMICDTETNVAGTIEYVLDRPAFTIGRSSANDIVLQQSVVSRRHATIRYVDERYVLQDSQSTNGTFVNERLIVDTYSLKDHDRIGFGREVASFRFIDPDPTFIPANALIFNASEQVFFVGQQRIDLPVEQQRLLQYLYDHPQRYCSRQSCIELIWNSADEELYNQALSDMIYKIRTELRRIAPTTEYIVSWAKRGYMLRQPAAE